MFVDFISEISCFSRKVYQAKYRGRELKEARAGDAVQIIGIPNIPTAGDFIYEVEDDAKAKYITSKRKLVASEEIHKMQAKNTLKSSKIKMNYR